MLPKVDNQKENKKKEQKQLLRELATVFFRLGAIAFGGPAAHIAMMDDEVVKRRQWMSLYNELSGRFNGGY